MDLPSTEWVRHVERKWTELGPAERQRFSALTESDEVFHYGLSLIHAEDLRTLSTISEKFSVEKSPEKSPELRQQGNLSFRSRDYTTAALLYSTAICHADRTEEISLCYANRSAALFHLGLHKDCLEDIQAALEAGYPSHLREKLSCRQTACLKQLQLDRPKAKSSTPETSLYARHSSCITVHFSPKKGRHVLASESQKAGEVMLEDEAFCFVLVPGLTLNTTAGGPDDTQDRHCHHCLGRTLRLVPCPSCSFARYCGESCQKDAWHRWHQWECKTGAELLACGVLAHLSLRVTVRAGQTEILMARASVSPTETCAQRQAHDTTLKRKTSALKENFADLTRSHHGNSYLSIYGLLPHVAHHPPSLRFLLAITVAALCKKMQNGPLPDVWPSAEDGLSGSRESQMSLLGATALRHMMQLRCNAQAVTAVNVNDNSGRSVQYSSEVRIATAIFPILSLLNHSCRPNTSVSFTTGNKTLCGSEGKPEHRSSCFGSVSVTVRASRRLTAGEEILHCYGPHSSRMAVKERQRLLLDQYFFLCDCQACQKDLTDESSNAEVPKASGLKCVKCGRPVMFHAGGYKCSWASCGHQITRSDLQHRLQGVEALLGQALHLMEKEERGPDKAQMILKSASSLAEGFLTEMHPLRGELADATSRLYASAGDWSSAASHLMCSITAVQQQFGEDSVELGRQLFKLAQLLFNGRDAVAALSVTARARGILSLHGGPNSEELQELEEMERCLKELL